MKYEEVEQNVPSLSKLRSCASNVYSVEIIKKMELAVLIELDWELAMVVPAHFLEAVLAVTGGGTFPHDDVCDPPWTPACTADVRKLACYLHSVCLQDADVATHVLPSLLAAAIIAAARLQLKIYPVWPTELHVATGYTCQQLGPSMRNVMQLYKDSLPPPAAVACVGMPGEAGGAAWVGADGCPGCAADTNMDIMDSVMHALEQPGGPGWKNEYPEGSREMMTPSPTGPLDAGCFNF